MRAAGGGDAREKRMRLPTPALRADPPLAARDETARVATCPPRSRLLDLVVAATVLPAPRRRARMVGRQAHGAGEGLAAGGDREPHPPGDAEHVVVLGVTPAIQPRL